MQDLILDSDEKNIIKPSIVKPNLNKNRRSHIRIQENNETIFLSQGDY
jgi:hypothetical protein